MACLSKTERRQLHRMRQRLDVQRYEEAQAADARFAAIDQSIRDALARSAAADARCLQHFERFV